MKKNNFFKFFIKKNIEKIIYSIKKKNIEKKKYFIKNKTYFFLYLKSIEKKKINFISNYIISFYNWIVNFNKKKFKSNIIIIKKKQKCKNNIYVLPNIKNIEKKKFIVFFYKNEKKKIYEIFCKKIFFFEHNIIKNIYYNIQFLNNIPLKKKIIKNIFFFFKISTILTNNYYFMKKFNIKKNNFFNIKFSSNKKILYTTYIIYRFTGIYYFLQNLTLFFLKKIMLKKNINLNINKYNNVSYNYINKLTSINAKIINDYEYYKLLNIIYFFFKYQNPNIFIQWIKFLLTNLYCRKQFKFLTILEYALNSVYKEYIKLNKLIFFRITFKGKLNNIGSVRKKKIIIEKNKISLNNINYNFFKSNDYIVTETGVIGLSVLLASL